MEISLASIFDHSRAALITHGAAPWVADTVAQAMRRAEATGNKICGLYYLESYCTQLASGRVNGTVEPVVSKPKTASVQVNAHLGFAQPALTPSDQLRQPLHFHLPALVQSHCMAASSRSCLLFEVPDMQI